MDTYKTLAEKISKSKCILLTTHKNCDADGFGSELAMYYALKKAGKDVHVVHYEPVHPRYHFINKDHVVKVFSEDVAKMKPDLVLAFDTNDQRLVEPLYKAFAHTCPFIFLDHHQILQSGPQPTAGSIIDVNSASTGEIAFKLIEMLNLELDDDIAFALYTSIAFDTHVFKFIRSSKRSYEIASKLLSFNIDSTYIHQMLFANGTIEKLRFMAHILSRIEFGNHNRSAICYISAQEMHEHQAGIEETHDILDQIMSVGQCVLAILIREERQGTYRISFRSKGDIKVLGIAEKFNGGGHAHASGATVTTDLKDLKSQLHHETDLLLQSAT